MREPRSARARPLFKIDDAELLSQVARLEADRDLAEQALARTRELIERNASSEADLELRGSELPERGGTAPAAADAARPNGRARPVRWRRGGEIREPRGLRHIQ